MERSEEDNFCNHSEDDDDYFQTSQEDSHVGSYRRSNCFNQICTYAYTTCFIGTVAGFAAGSWIVVVVVVVGVAIARSNSSSSSSSNSSNSSEKKKKKK